MRELRHEAGLILEATQVEYQAAVLNSTDDGDGKAAERRREFLDSATSAALFRGRLDCQAETRDELRRESSAADLAVARLKIHGKGTAERRCDGITKPLGHRAQLLRWPGQGAQGRKALDNALRIEIKLQHRRDRRDRHLVEAKRPLQGIALDPRYERRATDDEPGLRTAQQLVAAEGDDIGAVL